MKSDPSYFERYHFLDRRLPSSYWAFILTCVLAVVVFFAWATFCEIDIVVRAPSVIRPFANISTVKNATAGPVASKNYENGQHVEAGQALWHIDTNATLLDLSNSTTQLERVVRDLSQLQLYSDSLSVGHNVVGKQFAEAYNRAEAYFSNKKSLELQISSKRQKWEKESSLPTSMTNADKIQDMRNELDLAVLDLAKAEAGEKERVLTETKTLLTSRESLNQKIADLHRAIKESEVRAPIAGIVEDIKKININDYLVSGDDIVRIVPSEGETLKLEIHVDTRDIAEVKTGQNVTNLFQGLPPSKYGKILATVVTVPADSEVVNGQLSYFRVEATLEKSWVEDRKLKRIFLKPGMQADSRIIVSKKTILNYLLEKLEFIN